MCLLHYYSAVIPRQLRALPLSGAYTKCLGPHGLQPPFVRCRSTINRLSPASPPCFRTCLWTDPGPHFMTRTEHGFRGCYTVQPAEAAWGRKTLFRHPQPTARRTAGRRGLVGIRNSGNWRGSGMLHTQSCTLLLPGPTLADWAVNHCRCNVDPAPSLQGSG